MYTELRKREQMDIIMAETRKRKTRRGKKKAQKRNVFETDYDTLHFEWSPEILGTANYKNRHSLRPATSPKAPFNSNQFLIEDRGDVGTTEFTPAQTFEEETSIFEESDRYDKPIDHDLINSNLSFYPDDSYYEPLWVSDTSEFMLKEFEKDYNAASLAAFELESNFKDQLHIFDNVSKEEIVKKYLDLERKYSNSKSFSSKANTCNSSKALKQTIEDLVKENKKLMEENERFKSLLEVAEHQ